jgi:hypothetical protein
MVMWWFPLFTSMKCILFTLPYALNANKGAHQCRCFKASWQLKYVRDPIVAGWLGGDPIRLDHTALRGAVQSYKPTDAKHFFQRQSQAQQPLPLPLPVYHPPPEVIIVPTMKFLFTPLLALLLFAFNLPSTATAQETCAVVKPDDTEPPITHNTYRMLRGLIFGDLLIEYKPPGKTEKADVNSRGVLRLGRFQKGKFGICCQGYCMKLENFSPTAAYDQPVLQEAMDRLENKCVRKARHGWSRFKSEFFLFFTVRILIVRC